MLFCLNSRHEEKMLACDQEKPVNIFLCYEFKVFYVHFSLTNKLICFVDFAFGKNSANCLEMDNNDHFSYFKYSG